MIKNAILIYLAQWAGSLAILSFAAFAAFLSENGDHTALVTRAHTANDRFADVSVAVSQGYAATACASGVDGGATGAVGWSKPDEPPGRRGEAGVPTAVYQ